jgi:hypothetical protein
MEIENKIQLTYLQSTFTLGWNVRFQNIDPVLQRIGVQFPA